MIIFEKLKQYDVVLASQSPRRRELLSQSGIPFRVEVRPTREEFPTNMPAKEVAAYLAAQKAAAFKADLQDKQIIITADTIVVKEGKIYNKAANAEEAFAMIGELSGASHEVISGVCIVSKELEVSFSETTRVQFCKLSDEQIHYYIKHYQPFDKAGAYGIQEWIGLVGITSIEGSYHNVMGLPMARLYAELINMLGYH